MEKIPTALEMFQAKEYTNITTLMVKFAQIHVEAALKAASEKGEAIVRTNGEWTSSKVTAGVNKESILNSYSLENIK